MPSYEDAFKYKLIYIMAINNSDHDGYLKIGEATLASDLGPKQLPPQCNALNNAAHKRIKGYTKTALISYELLYTEIALRFVEMNDGTTMSKIFSDKDIHDVLARSGYYCRKFPDTDRDSEWYKVDLPTAINAIKAFKEHRNVLSAAEKTSKTTAETREIVRKIVLREEQQKAVEKTIHAFKTSDTMLWDCKMRFGKTLTAYELIRRARFKKTIIVTHRPVVEDGWEKDHELIFLEDSNHLFVTKKINGNNYEYDASIDSENERNLKNYSETGIPFAYFASMQDLRGSIRAGGKFEKNNAVFDMDWDLIIYDEAHEGTMTDLGQTVQELLGKPKNGKKPKILSLSGTPYNLLSKFEENLYTWDYVMEQRRKQEFAELHADEHNPYADLPEMRIYTFDLQECIPTAYRYETEDMAFNFKEFFRTWTGDPKQDFYPIPAGKNIGEFVHESDVRSFLDLITCESRDSHYPFSNQRYRDMFRHTFWMVPGVKEARALSSLLKQHPVFSNFFVVNVAGEGDIEEEFENALKKVQNAILRNPYSITISCGRLTTGVTVPEWSAVMMLSGSSSTAASGYMQTIFRVQSAGNVNGKQKTVAYVFDFAPDRALKVLSEVHNLSNKGRVGDGDFKASLGEFLNFCPVISVAGTQMLEYDVPKMMRQIKKITVEKAIKSGFDDESVYKEGVGIVMDNDDVKLFNKLASIIHGQPKSKLPANITINQQGLTNEQYQQAEKIGNKLKRERTVEEEAILKKQKELKREQEKVLRLLRAVSIRLPLLIYGAKVDLSEEIRIEDFVNIVDGESWVEFMPANVNKDLFKQLLKYYDEDVVIGAGLRIRRLARAADELPPTRRAQRLAEIFALFRNPDKETVLTPWRVVNMHMGDILGGYNFYGEGCSQDAILVEPRLIDNGDITADVFLNPESRLLDMNSKSGLYPLYLCYSLYAIKLPKPEDQLPLEETQKLWRETLSENIFVLCKTTMAQSITRRTLAGYNDDWEVNAIHLSRLLDRMQDKARLTRKISNPATWGKEGERLKFDAIVGNPPYQMSDGGNKASAVPIYHLFVEQAINLGPRYLSMIMPARWYSGGRNLESFREMMLNDSRIRKLFDFQDSNDCFAGVDIAGGLCYFLWDSQYNGDCIVVNCQGADRYTTVRTLHKEDVFIRDGRALPILDKVRSMEQYFYSERVSSQKPFGLRTYVTPMDEGDILLRYNKGKGPFKREMVTAGIEWIDKWKVIMSYLTHDHAGRADKEGRRRIFSTLEVLEPKEICTETYIVIDNFDTKHEAYNLLCYLKSKFVRFLVAQITTTQHISKASFTFVPMQDFTKLWTDAELYAKYSLSNEEIDLIESTIRSME